MAGAQISMHPGQFLFYNRKVWASVLNVCNASSFKQIYFKGTIMYIMFFRHLMVHLCI
jgi:hypothetical protein